MSTESTPKERIERLVVLMKRSRRYARSTAAIAMVLGLVSLALALTTKRTYRSETTVIYRDAVRTGATETPTQRAARLGPRLKEYVLSRSRLQSVIEQFDLYPELVERSMLDAMEEMQKHISFRTRSQDTFALSFSHDHPQTAQAVTARLAETMIADYMADHLDSALTTHDVLRTEVESAQKHVEETSRALARFLAKHPQFTWGLGDNPYAAGQPLAGIQGLPAAGGPREPKEKPILDAVLAQLLEQLRIVDAELAGRDARVLPPPIVTPSDAQKQRDAAAAALTAAETDLAQKLTKVTMAHPDAISAKSRVDRARAALAAAESNLTQAFMGATPPPIENSSLDPARRAELETQRKSLVAQIAARRAGPKPKSTPTAEAPESKKEGPDIVELETEWHKLRLDLERARDAFRKAEDKERAARLLASSAEREVQEALIIADAAFLPVHPEKGRGRVFFAGSFIAVFLALAYAGARVLLCDTLFDEGDVLALGGPPLLVSVPHIPAIGPPAVVATIRSPNTPPPSTRASRSDAELERGAGGGEVRRAWRVERRFHLWWVRRSLVGTLHVASRTRFGRCKIVIVSTWPEVRPQTAQDSSSGIATVVIISSSIGMYRIGAERDACAAQPNICKTNLTEASFMQCKYGYRTGLDWGTGSRVYDELDRCAFWHDNGCWSVNLNSGVDEGSLSCSQNANFIHCIEQVMPESIEEAQTKECVMASTLRSAADICKPFGRWTFYPLYSGNMLAATTKPWCSTSWR